MADPNSPVRHRLELLERTIYSLQAQQRLLEYRVQHIEEEHQNLHQTASSILPQAGRSLFQPSTQTLTPKASSGRNSYISELQALAKESDYRLGEHAKALSSLSLLDAPSLLTTPILTPTRKVFSPKSTPNPNLQARYSPLAPSSAEALEFEPSEGSRPYPSASVASTLICCSPKSTAIETPSKTIGKELEPLSSNTARKERKFVVVPWDGTIAWKFINLYQSKKEEQEAILSSMDHCDVQDEWFFQYGLRYIPKPSDKDAYRTIRIENLPETTTLDKVLAEIHCGNVFSADLLNTFPITGYHTARIVFLHQVSAEQFSRSVKKSSLIIEGSRAQVTLEKTATYPVSMSMKKTIWDGCTRCVTIDEVPEALLECIEQVIGGTFLKNSVESYYKEYCSEQARSKLKVCVRFHSMRAASCAFKELQRNIFLRNSILRYDSDPCNKKPHM
ncbi:hypothetical protein EYB25_003995 [Talaromyces marneffei]|uniref:RNA-binding protein MRN1 n=1 Tax=Talaromyces marneffei PM1 TaxID=1077442 RepID=A0A093VNX2_TALMA|nr:uncharacterized protein EYB26_004917 [Talaromyces marneffei]KAE8552616.1 hypothetical protein EYB25_003995 [Talaromyces marneffei]QGA17247.1 hypothetical protein EYB26_004917 [Talaromyces marneffei]